MNQVYQVAYKMVEENRALRDTFSIHKTLKGALALYEEIVEDCNLNDGYTLLSKTDKVAEFRINSRPSEQHLTIYINKIPLQS